MSFPERRSSLSGREFYRLTAAMKWKERDSVAVREILAGKEWKTVYGKFLAQFIQHKIFPADIEIELQTSLKNPAATSCAEDGLLRVLRNYDTNKSGFRLVEELPSQTKFKTSDGRVFLKGLKLRKRFKCVELATGKIYLFSPVYEVEECA